MNDALLRELVPAVIAVLVRRGAEFASAEDAVQEALVSALASWPQDPPRDPKGWLVATAWRKAVDEFRAGSSRRARELALHAEPPSGPYRTPTTRWRCTSSARSRRCRRRRPSPSRCAPSAA